MPSRAAIAERASLGQAKRIVVKIGSAVLADERGLARDALERLTGEIAALHQRGLDVTVVSSGAIAAGRTVLGNGSLRSIPERQAAASVGQILLMAEYQRCFAAREIVVAQILLDAEDLSSRHRYLNAEHAISTLHHGRIIPIVNENDTVSVDELKFGDNDNLSALVATLVGADVLIILSDVPGLFEADPRHHPDARRIPVVARVDASVLALAGGSESGLGTGGMQSKLLAARKASASGIATLIADGRSPGILARVIDGDEDIGTLVLPSGDRLARRKHWIAFTLKPRGTLRCDDGAVRAVLERGRSLLPSGVTAVDGRFEAGDCVRLVGPLGEEFARGLVTYGAAESARIAGRQSEDVESILGYRMGDALVHRDDLVILGADGSPEGQR